MKKEVKPRGRPRKGEDARLHYVTSSYTANEYEQLQKQAQAAGVSLTVLVRSFSLTGQLTNVHNAEEQALKRGLVGLGNNLNQVAKLAHANGFLATVESIDEVMESLWEVLKKYHNVPNGKSRKRAKTDQVL